MQNVSECSAIDPGYCTQSNSLTNNVQPPSLEYLEATSRQLKPATMHHSRPKKNRRSGNVYNITTNNYFTAGSSKQTCSLQQHQSPNQVTIITIHTAYNKPINWLHQ